MEAAKFITATGKQSDLVRFANENGFKTNAAPAYCKSWECSKTVDGVYTRLTCVRDNRRKLTVKEA